MKDSNQVNRHLKKSLLLMVTSVVTTFFVIEFALTIYDKLSENNNHATTNKLYHAEIDKDLGLVLKRNYQFRARKQDGKNRTIYDVIYTTDQFRRREVENRINIKKPHIILAGCSYIFGEGLNDNETLHFYLNEKLDNYNIYNYASHGSSPNQFLAKLEQASIKNEIKTTGTGYLIYFFVDFHLRRILGSLNVPWTYDMPYYFLDNNQILRRDGNFKTGRKIETHLYLAFNKFKKYSSIFKKINLEIPKSDTSYSIDLAHKIFLKIKDEYLKQLSGEVLIWIHPLSLLNDRISLLINKLQKSGIKVIQTPINHSDTYMISGDPHPSSYFNKLFAEKIIQQLDFNKLVYIKRD